jgi:hypothetical protein
VWRAQLRIEAAFSGTTFVSMYSQAGNNTAHYQQQVVATLTIP